MNRNVLKSVAEVAAFLVGVSINDSCGDSPYGGDTAELWSSVRSLTEEVAELRTENKDLRDEIARLKKEVADLGNGEGNTSGEFLVDGLYFDRNGQVSSKPKRQTGDESGFSLVEYRYDNQGREKTRIYYAKGYTTTYGYSYSGKNVTSIQTTEYDPSVYPDSKNTSSTTVTEYY